MMAGGWAAWSAESLAARWVDLLAAESAVLSVEMWAALKAHQKAALWVEKKAGQWGIEWAACWVGYSAAKRAEIPAA
jgi:hypothetical protein